MREDRDSTGDARSAPPSNLTVGEADALRDDPAVPKERLQGRNNTSLARRAAPAPPGPAAPDERRCSILIRRLRCRGRHAFLASARQPRLRPQRRAVGRLSALREDGLRARRTHRSTTRASAAWCMRSSCSRPTRRNGRRRMIADRSVAGASEAFWNKVEAFEKRSDAQLAKEFIIALPLELTAEQNIALMRAFRRRAHPAGGHGCGLGLSRRSRQSACPSDDDAAAADRGRVWSQEGGGSGRGWRSRCATTPARSSMSSGPVTRLHSWRFAMAGSICRTSIWRSPGSTSASMAAPTPSVASTSCRPSISASAPRRSSERRSGRGGRPDLDRLRAVRRAAAGVGRADRCSSVRRSCSTSSRARRASSTSATSPRSCIAMSTMPARSQCSWRASCKARTPSGSSASGSTLRPARERRIATPRAN